MLEYEVIKVGDILHQDFVDGEWFYEILGKVGGYVEFRVAKSLEELYSDGGYSDRCSGGGWNTWLDIPTTKFTLLSKREPSWEV